LCKTLQLVSDDITAVVETVDYNYVGSVSPSAMNRYGIVQVYPLSG